jgi:hypothetical protein
MNSNETIKEIAARWWADQFLIDEKREDFYKSLIVRIPDGDEWQLETDYDPKDELLEAVQAVTECSGYMWSCKGILPMSTMMRYEDGDLTVSKGRGAPWVQIGGRI